MKNWQAWKTVIRIWCVWGVLAVLFVGMAYADKSSVRIEVPETAVAGEPITIVLHVSHHGNNFIHHTDWLRVAVNGEDVQRWEFGSFSKPESAEFVREIAYTPAGSFEISAEANCNLHGSTGIVKQQVSVSKAPSSETSTP